MKWHATQLSVICDTVLWNTELDLPICSTPLWQLMHVVEANSLWSTKATSDQDVVVWHATQFGGDLMATCNGKLFSVSI